MRVWGKFRIFDEQEEELIHQTALRIMNEVGFAVEEEKVLERLEEFGGRVNRETMRVFFSPDFVEGFISASEPFDWNKAEPHVSGHAAIYHGYYLDPQTDEYRKWAIRDILSYLKVARNIGISGSASYPMPVDDIPDEALVPFFHYLSLKFSGRSAAGVNNVRWAPIVLEMCEAYAGEAKRSVQEVMTPVHIHLSSPLRFSREEAKIFAFFAERGLRIGIGTMGVLGSNAPVTLAGAVVQYLASNLFINIVYRAFFGERRLSLGSSISPMDMRTLMQSYGRPEKELCNLAMAQMAFRYNARFSPHTGHSDAKRPGPEAGFEKALNSIPSLLMCGRAGICCGLLSVDEVFSPVQMVIDREIVGALRRFVSGFEVSEETLAFDAIKEVGPSGVFTGTEHTARHFRKELWEPILFARDMFSGWMRKGAKTELDLAREICLEALSGEPLPVQISDELERKMLTAIAKVTGAQIAPVEPV